MPIADRLLLAALLLPAFTTYAQSPRAGNDGFQRHDGTMCLIRNGQRRPMAHDVHLPNGRTVTRDGFVVEADGRRAEVAEGRGCTLLGEPTMILPQPDGQLALAAPGRSRQVAPVVNVAEVGVLEQLFGRRGKGHRGWGHHKKKHGKH